MWSIARQNGRAAEQRHIQNGVENDGNGAWRRYLEMRKRSYDFENHKCFFCGRGGRLKTGFLEIIGAIWKCSNCKSKYEDARK